MKAPAGADTAPLHCGFTELVVSLKTTAPTTSNHSALAALACDCCSVSGSCLRSSGSWEMTSGICFHPLLSKAFEEFHMIST